MLNLVVTLWWLGFWTAVGLCVGSFLNVVIYRLPRGQSLREPLWSACPSCRRRIRWYDNLPIISFILLRGRCRDCGVPIATRYLIIEASMALVVLMLIDAFFIGHVRSGLFGPRLGLTEQFSYDWPILLAHIILFACLLSMSAIDLEHYWVDVRFTNLATIAGFALHVLWTPKHSTDWPRPFDTTAVMSLCAVAGLGLVWIMLTCQPHVDPEDFDEPQPESEPEAAADSQPAFQEDLTALYNPPARGLGWVTGMTLLLLFVSLMLAGLGSTSPGHWLRALLPLTVLFVLIFRESTVAREADQQIAEAIHEERHEARAMVLTEAALLLPAVLLACVGFYVMSKGEAADRISQVLHAGTRVGAVSMMRSWEPLQGLATAAAGYIIAGGLGWAVRIVFTLIFGREAFGAGDIHLMAAAGCIAGWPVVVLGFALACGLALLGWLCSLPFKRTRAVPLGPWLSLSFLSVVIFYESMLKIPVVARVVELSHLLFFRNSQT